MKHANCVMIAFLLSGITVYAQEVVSTAGCYGETSSGSLSWTVGEAVVETITDGSNSLTQGFQQSRLVVTAIHELPGLDFTISVFPNPASDFLTVKVEKNDKLTHLMYLMYDINGKLLLQKMFEGKEITIFMRHFKPSTYILKVTEDNKEVKTFRIIKK